MKTKLYKSLNKGVFILKKMLLTGSIILFSFSLYAQITWDGEAGTTNWGDALNWSGNALPLPGEDVAIDTALSITGVPTITLNSLSVTQNVILRSTAGATITINNINATPAINISSSQTLTLGGGTAITSVNLIFQTITGATTISGTLANTAFNAITLNNGQTLDVTGSLANVTNATILINGVLNNSGTGTLLANAGTMTVNGTINNGGTVNGLPGNLSFASGATYNHNRNRGFVPASTWNTASNCNISGLTNAALTGGLNQTFGNLAINCAGLTSPLVLTLSGDLIVQGNFFLQGTSPANTITLAPVAKNLTITGTTTINSNGIFNDANADGVNTFTGNVVINGEWNNSGNQVFVFGGNLTVNAGAVFNSGGGVYTMSGNGKTIDGTIAGITISNLAISGTVANNLATLTIPSVDISGTLTNRSGMTITCNTLLSGTGSFIQETNSTLNIGTSATIATFTAVAAGNTVNYTNNGAQNILPVNYYNLTLSGGGNKILTANTDITGTLDLISGVLQLGNFNLTFTGTTGTASITGTPMPGNMIETNGTGVLSFTNASLANTALNGTYPVGYNGTYNPLVVSGLAGGAANRTFSVRVVPGQLFVNGLNRYWEITQINVTGIASLSFKYNSSEVSGDTTKFQPYTNITGVWALAPSPSAQGVNPVTSTTSSALPAVSLWTAATPGVFYSYQTGDWNNATTWTNDPSGSTLINPLNAIPGYLDAVILLTGRTVSLTTNISTSELNITISSGGFLDMATFAFTSGLKGLSGLGTLRLASTSFPAVVNNNFITGLGGTTEYNNATSFNLPSSPVTYNHLSINTGTAIATQTLGTLTLHGNLHVKSGTFRINDATPVRLTLIVKGNVTVENGASITIGTGVTNSTTDPSAVANGGTAPFINYYNQQSHRVEIFGDFTNRGSVRFTNLTYPVYNAFPPTSVGATTGFATVFFRGSTNNSLTCNNTTDFYNLVIDKGFDQTFSLTIYASAYPYFKLFGANTAAGDIAAPATNANPNLKKALWICNGTLILKGLTVIPSLTEGAIAGSPSSDYFIPANGALLIDGTDVVVLSTADDYREVNAAYGVSGGSGLVNGIALGGNSALSVLGKLQVNAGYISTRESAGLTYWNYASGQIIVNGGTIDSKQFRDALSGNTGLISFVQNGGNVVLRGRFQRDASPYSGVPDLENAAMNTTRAINGVDVTGNTGTFSLNTNTANGYTMTGGSLNIYDVCGNTNALPYLAYQIGSSVSNINVTGGTIQILPTQGTGSNPSHYLLNSTAPIANLLIDKSVSTAIVQLNTLPILILKNINLANTAVFDANGLDVTVGGNFTLANGTTYTNLINQTIFNGSGNQQFTVNLAGALSLYSLIINKTGTDTLEFAGTQNTINISDNLTLSGGRLGDNGNTIYVAGNIIHSGVHYGTGRIVLNGTNLQTINGNGSGVFNNLELNNTNAAVAPVALSSGIAVTGILQLVSNKIFNIGSNNLNIAGTGSIASTPGFSNSCFIQTSGLAGDGGITKSYSSSATNFIFPLGAPTITPVQAAAYSPASVGITGTPASYGTITVVPVGIEHPNTTVKGRSLTYYWRVRTGGGFNLGSATATHTYSYAVKDIVTGAGISENEYVPARYEASTYSWTSGTTASINTFTHTIEGPWLTNSSFIDGEYTAGDNNPVNPFGIPQKLYSRMTGLWGDVDTWSKTGHTVDDPPAIPPGASDIVIIGGNDSVSLATDLYNPNTDVRICASLQIEKGSALDIGFNPGCNFGVVGSHPNGNGNFRLTTSFTSGTIYTFPSGDFSDFNVNVGTTEFYTVNPAVGPYFILPANASSYGTVILSPLGGSNLILPNIPIVTIYGDLICRGETWESWLAMSWNGTYGAIVPKTVYVKKNLDLQGGSFLFSFNGVTAQRIIIDGDVKVAPSAGIDIYSASNNIMSIGGSLINNSNNGGPAIYGGFAGSNVRFYKDAGNYCDVVFFGTANASITNTANAPNTSFNRVTVNKGSSRATTLNVNIGGTLTTRNDNWLTMQNGTLIYNRTGDLNISTITPFTIPSTAGLTVNTPSNIYIAQGNASNNTFYLNGKLTLTATNTGNVYVGNLINTGVHNDIEYSSGGASELEVDGGSLIVNGQIRRNPSNAAGILKYTQTGGAVTIYGSAVAAVPSNVNNAKLEVLNYGSQFNMSAGTLTIVRGGGGSTFGDLYLRPQTGSVTGGSIVFSQGAIASPENYLLDANIPLNNLTVTGGAGQMATVRLMVSPLTLTGDLTLSNVSSIFNATNGSNSMNVTVNGNFTNNGGIASYIYGTNLTTFSATNAPPYFGAQSLTGATNFYDLQVSPLTSLTLNNGIIIANDLNIGSGTLIIGGNRVDVAGNFTNNGNFTDINAPNTGILLNGSMLQYIEGNGSFGRLELNNPAGASLNSSITLQEDLVMNQGILDANNYLFTLGVSSNIIGAPFSETKMITTQGVFSNIGIKKFFSASPQVFTYPIGTSGKYTPAVLTINASSYVGSVRINNINNSQPSVIDPANALRYYWEVESSGMSGFDGNLVLKYLPGDVQGSQESNYLASRLIVPGTSWSLTNTVNTVAKTVTFNFSNSNNLSGQYTAGIPGAFPPNVPTFTSNANGNWTNNTIWTQIGGTPFELAPGTGPDGFIAIVNDTVTINKSYTSSYKITIHGKLKVVSPYFGHNLGTVDGNGTLYLEAGTFPAGVYTTFLNCASNGTVEYGGIGNYTIVADLYEHVPNLLFSGTGTRVMPNKDLTICNSFIIGTLTDGPAVDNSIYNKKLTIEGTLERYGTGTFNAGTGATATVAFAGTAPQFIGGATGKFVGFNALNNLEINNSLGLTLSDTTVVNENLLLTDGLINTSAISPLIINNTAFINCVIPAGGSTSSFVNGPLVKRINQGDDFLFPVGQGSIPGNKLSLSATQTGTLLWTAQYFNPNSTFASYTPPLAAVSWSEYWKVSVSALNKAIINLKWDPSSDITPLVTQTGLDDMRVAGYNTGTNSWTALSSSAAGDDYNGTVSTTERQTIPASGSADFTIGSVTTLVPKAKLSPTGPVCGTEGIPVSFSAPGPIAFNYALTYKVDGGAPQSVVITPAMMPYRIPTNPVTSQTVQLTAFTYNADALGMGGITGVVDGTIITAYANPTTSDAGTPQSLCGITSTTLNGNTPLVGTGLWSILLPNFGGTVITPGSPVSQFIGLNGKSYTLQWRISNGTCTSSDSVTVSFTLLPDPPAAAAAQTFCTGAFISDLVASSPGSIISWFANPTGGSALPGTTPLVNGGNYYTEADNGCISESRTQVTVTLNQNPTTASISGDSIPICMATGIVYDVTLTPGSEYNWSVPDDAVVTSGITGPDNNQITVNFGIESGKIEVIETNQYGCQGDPVQLIIELQGCDLVAGFSANDTAICVGEEVIFTDESQGTNSGSIYQWNFGLNAVPATAAGSGPHTITYTTSGLKTVQLIISNDVSDEFLRSDYITVNEIPVVSIESADRCGPGNIEFSALPVNGDRVDFSSDGGINIIYSDNSTPYVYTTVIGESASMQIWARAFNTLTGCIGTWDSTAIGISHSQPVTPPILVPVVTVAEEGYINVVCSGDEGVNYYVNPVSGSTYNWTIPALGFTRENASEIQVDWLIGRGEYAITVQEISAFGCDGTIRDTMVLVAQPVPDLGEDVNICAGKSAVFALPDEYQEYLWPDGSVQQSFTTSQAGFVSVTVTDKYGCQGGDTTLLTVYPVPSIDLGSDTVICGENSVSLNAGEYELYQWSTGETINPIQVFSGVKTVFVTVTDRNGCQDSDTIKVLACNPLLLLEPVTNTFTPNNDKVHDTWEIRNIQLFPDASIKVYDRWGRLVFNVDKGYQNGWDGTCNGKDLPVDTYYFLIDLKSGDDPITGTVTIIR